MDDRRHFRTLRSRAVALMVLLFALGNVSIARAQVPDELVSYPDWIFETWERDLGRHDALALMRAGNEPLETVIRLHLPELFPGMELDNATVFCVSRNSEYEIDDDEVEDLLKTIEEEVRKRRRSFAVRR